MYVVRPVELTDIAALEALAAVSMPGVHTLPKTREKIVAMVERSIASFAAHVDIPSEEAYLLVLEAPGEPGIVGTAAIFAAAGSNGTYFSFRNDVIQQVSRDLNISHSVHALTLCSELTGYSQLSSFYVGEREHGTAEAALLSRARLMFAVLAPHRFSDRFFVPLAGVTDSAGGSPFWDALGRKFFKMDFLDAERVIGGARNRTLIVELMPHYPVYVPLLPGDAQAAMGQIHPSGELAFNLLTAEGFEADDYIDIFDGGPILQAHKNSLRTFSGALQRRVALADEAPDRGREPQVRYAVAAAAEHQFRAVVTHCAALESQVNVSLSADVQDAFERLSGVTISEGYGLTEAGPTTHCNPIQGPHPHGSMGVPFPDTDARIVDVETGHRDVSIGEAGELVVRGPQVMQGYWNNEAETRAVLRDGWLYTGDIVRRDEDGFFFFMDRKKDVIKPWGDRKSVV